MDSKYCLFPRVSGKSDRRLARIGDRDRRGKRKPALLDDYYEMFRPERPWLV